jgi:hypothetical protein
VPLKEGVNEEKNKEFDLLECCSDPPSFSLVRFLPRLREKTPKRKQSHVGKHRGRAGMEMVQVKRRRGFKFKYPACFELNKTIEEEGFFDCGFLYEWKTNDRINRATLGVNKEDANHFCGKSIYEIVNMSKEALLFMENAKISEITLDRKPAVMLITDEKRVFKYGGSEFYNVQVIVECKHEGWVYGIDFGSLSYEPVPDSWYKEAISSFEFL